MLKLDINENNIGPKGATAIADALKVRISILDTVTVTVTGFRSEVVTLRARAIAVPPSAPILL